MYTLRHSVTFHVISTSYPYFWSHWYLQIYWFDVLKILVNWTSTVLWGRLNDSQLFEWRNPLTPQTFISRHRDIILFSNESMTSLSGCHLSLICVILQQFCVFWFALCVTGVSSTNFKALKWSLIWFWMKMLHHSFP